MNVVWQRDKGILNLDANFKVTSIVRNELNGWRKLHDKNDVIYHTPKISEMVRFPVMPRPFPLGKWNIINVLEKGFPYFPFAIITDAHQQLQKWKLDTSGGYDEPYQNIVVDDYGYWLHCAWTRDGVDKRGKPNYRRSNTTHGCGNVIDKDVMIYLADNIKIGDTLEVV